MSTPVGTPISFDFDTPGRFHRKRRLEEVQAAAENANVSSSTEGRKKKKHKRDSIEEPQVEPAATEEPDPEPSTMSLLSAIVAAATGAPQYPYSTVTPNEMHLPSDGSNQNVLQALQDLDLTKIAHVLKTLGEAAAANMPLDEPYPQVSAPEIPALGQIPASSEAILAIDEEITPMARAPALAVEQYTSEDHAHILATKWLTTGQLAEMVRTTGLVYKKGKFSATETQQVRDAVEHYRLNRELSQEQLDSIIFPKNEKEKDNGFWTEVAMAVPQRPLVAVYHHVRRAFHPLKHQGKWMPAEDDRLRESVANYGQQWEKVSEHVGRRSADCRDRYRNHIVNQDIRVHGAWAKEEEEKLTKIVTEMTISQGRDMDNDVFWGVVSEKMGGTRGRQQCRIKWTDCLSQVVKNEGEKPRWGSQDAYVLVRKVDSLNIHDDTEIDWKTLSDPNWNFWSAHVLQRRWLTMKRSVKGWEEMAHQEIMDILKAKKVNIPPSSASTKRRKERKAASSAEAVVDSDPPPVAPSSTKSKKSKGKRKADT